MPTDPERWSEKRKARVDELFDLLAAAPDGLTKYEIADGLNVPVMVANGAIRDLRLAFQNDTINLAATPNGHRRPWLYQLVGNYEDARPWLVNRVGDLEARLETIEAVSGSIVNGARRGSIEHRKSSLINRRIRHLREELAAIVTDER